MDITIQQLTQATADDAHNITALMPQMTNNKFRALNAEHLQEVLDAGTVVLVARDGERVVGAMALVRARQLVGDKYWVEDLVVDQAYRGHGIASRLMDLALGLVPDGAYSVNLTSKASRTAAHTWYERLGFVQSSMVFRLRRK